MPKRTLPPVKPQTLVHPLQAFGYQYATHLLEALVNRGWLDAEQIQTICDFGAGTGGPTLALCDFFKCPDRNMSLLESYPSQVRMLKALLPGTEIVDSDGLLWLSTQRQRYDLITAFMLGPDDESGQFATDFLNQAIPSLKSEGKLLICSDVATMHGVLRRVRKMSGLHCDWFIPEQDILLPVSVVISRTGHQTANNKSQQVILPAPIMVKSHVPDAQHDWEMEEYCLTTAFEKAYFQATVNAFIFQSPEHPAIPVMQAMLMP